MDTLAPIARGVQIGIDIGQKHDPTAIVVAQRELRGAWIHEHEFGKPDQVPKDGEIHYVVRFIQRVPLNTSYPDVAARIADIYGQLDTVTRSRPAAHQNARFNVMYPNERVTRNIHACYIDVTGVGRPVFDLLTSDKVKATAVTITGSDKVSYDGGEVRLGKVLMVSNLQVLLQTKRIHLPDNDEARALTDELMDYEMRVTDTAHLEMGAKTGKHDDLATALGLATWENVSFEPPPLTYSYDIDINNLWRNQYYGDGKGN